jgi:hypothetical protein
MATPKTVYYSDKLNRIVTTKELLDLCAPGKNLHQVKMFYQVRDMKDAPKPSKKLVTTRMKIVAKACLDLGLDPVKTLSNMIVIK